MGSFSGAFKPVSLIAPVEVSLVAGKPVFGVFDGVFPYRSVKIYF